jgi:hypothetical protein
MSDSDHESAEQNYLQLDYFLNRADDSDMFRNMFAIGNATGNVPIISWSRCTPDCDKSEHFIYFAVYDVCYEIRRSLMRPKWVVKER